MKQRLLLIFSFIALNVAEVMAQGVSVNVPREVATGENFRLSFEFSTQEVEDFRLGQLPDGLEVLAGPYTSRRSSYSIVNGHSSSSSTITYTYTVYAGKAGSYTIPAAHAKADGKAVASQPVKISVSGQAKAKGSSSPRMHDDSEQIDEAGKQISGSDLFIRVTANKHRVTEQEPVMLTYKVYSLVDLTQLEGKMPDLKGFHTQEIQLPQQKSWHAEKVNGRNYRCVTWSQYVLFPQMTGRMTIPAITFKGTVIQRYRSVDPFEAFFNGGSGYTEVKKNITAPAVNIEVVPLPKKPASFSGGVGKFSIKASVDKAEVKAGEPITLRVTVQGVGNLKLLKQPEPQFPDDFDRYDPKQSDRTKLTANGVEGSVTYDFLVVPRNQGNYTIPAIDFVYYDTQSSSYRTSSTKPISLKVNKGDASSGRVATYSQQADNDIRQQKLDESRLRPKTTSFYGTATYYALLVSIFGAFVVLLIVFRKRAIDNADIVKMRGRRANKVATKRLKKAATLMQRGDSGAFYDEVLRALWGYVGDKLNMPVEQLSRDNIAAQLSERKVDQATIDSLLSALDECEYSRYAPGDATGNMNKTYTSASEAIMNIEDFLKKRRHKSDAATVLLLFVLSSAVPSVAAPADSTSLSVKKEAASATEAVSRQTADEAYANGNYQLAISQYEQLAATGESFELYYNLGCAYYRVHNLPKAMLWFERARLLSPSDGDVRFNLQFVNGRTIDRIPLRTGNLFSNWYASLASCFSADGWAVVAVISVSLALILLLVYLFVENVAMRKIGFFGAAGFIVVFFLANLLGWTQGRVHSSPRRGIVMQDEVQVRKTPTPAANAAFSIHEATRVTITDSTRTWREIRLDDNRTGWIEATAIEEI